MTRKADEADLGLGLEPGADHYRAYVGPPEDYDLIAAMTFGLLTGLGLRQHHRMLDIGCGSLRVGRLLIPYLNRGRYTGFEPNRWLVEAGIEKECGRDQIAIKQPRFIFDAEPGAIDASDTSDTFGPYDFALAQSIFSHCGLDLIANWLEVLARNLESSGVLVATFIEDDEDHSGSGWVYPECVAYRRKTIERMARDHGYQFRILDWHHPRQTWCLFSRQGFASGWLGHQSLSWNGSVAAGLWEPT